MMTENTQNLLIAAVVPTIAALGALVVGWRNSGKLSAVAKTTESVHTLVNSQMGATLRIASVALRRVADLTREEADIAASDLASKMLAEHEAKQAKVDAAAGKPAVLAT